MAKSNEAYTEREQKRIDAVNRYQRGERSPKICKSLDRSRTWLQKWIRRFNNSEKSARDIGAKGMNTTNAKQVPRIFFCQNMTLDKLGGAHTTIIGGRTGRKAVETIAQHPMVKRIIPSVISVKGTAGGRTIAKILRPDARGNLRLLISAGTTAQELRIITTAGSVEQGEVLRCELDEMLSEALADRI